MKLGGFSLFRIGGIEIIIDYSWFIIFFLAIYMAASYFPQQYHHYTTPQYWLMGIVFAFMIFASVLIHELAHTFVALRHGIKISSIRLLVFGGLTQTSEPKSGRSEFLIALAGPAASMILGLFSLAIFSVSLAARGFTPISEIALWMCLSNVSLAILNLIPGFPLDGGRILRAFLWDHWDDMPRATKVVSRLGNGFALFLIIFGALLFFIPNGLIWGIWLIFIGMIMKQSAVGSFQGVMLRNALAGVQVRKIMTENLVTVDWLMPVDQLVSDYIYKHQFAYFPVFSREEFIGMVSLEGVKTVPKELWGFKQVRDIMTPVELVPFLKPTDDATDALTRMVSDDIGQMPVVENGHLLGIVSRRDIMNLIKIKSDLGVE